MILALVIGFVIGAPMAIAYYELSGKRWARRERARKLFESSMSPRYSEEWNKFLDSLEGEK